MRKAWLVLAALALAAFGVTAPAVAATGSADYSIWNVDGPVVRVRFILPASEARPLEPNAPRLDSAGVSAAAGALLSVASAGGDCPPVVQDQWAGKYYVLADAGGAFRFEMRFQCPDARGIVLHDQVLFDETPGHIDYAKVQVGNTPPALRLFTGARRAIALPAAGAPPSEGLAPFASQGVQRLLSGADALALVGGLLLLARRWRDLADIALALAIGYGAALAIDWAGAIAPDLGLASAGMGASAAILGLCALRLRSVEAPPVRRWLVAGLIGAVIAGAALVAAGGFKGLSAGLAAAGLLAFAAAQAWITGQAPRLRLLLFAPAVLFGLLDGTGWAQALARLQMPGSRLAPALLGYDLGALAALAGAAALGMGLLWLAGRRLRGLQPFGLDLAAAVLAGLGLFWFVSRLYSV